MPVSQINQAVSAVASSSPGVSVAIFFPVGNEHDLLAAFNRYNLKRIRIKNLRWNNVKEKYCDIVGLYATEELYTRLANITDSTINASVGLS
jgi:hypothetical protein